MRFSWIVLLFPAVAFAQQTHPDIPLTPTSGVYSMKVQAPVDLDMEQICCVRADASPAEELGCVPAGPSEVVTFDVTVAATPDDDAALRCYAVDTSGLVSDYSDNAYLLDFTRPGKPVVQ
jgi:hypothetical protein